MPQEIIEKYSGLVYATSKRFYGIETEDLIQAGFLGLMKAYNNYNKGSTAKFTTYAYPYIYGEMYETTNKARTIQIQKDGLKLYKKLCQTKDELTQIQKREVSFNETADYLGLDKNFVYSVLSVFLEPVKLDKVDNKMARSERIDDLIMLKQSLQRLTNDERRIIETRYLSDFSQQETAELFSLSQSKVSRLEASGKEKIRNFVKS